MILGKVVGTVVSTQKEEKVRERKFLLVETIKPSAMKGTGDHKIAIDAVGAGLDDYVLLVAGSSARMTSLTDGLPCDLTIVAIVDEIEAHGQLVYQRSRE